METITPEGWFILKLPQEEDKYVYKVFSSWREGDQWRLSSGASSLDNLQIDGTHITFPQSSGSLYRLPLEGEGGASYYTMEVLERILEQEGLVLSDVKVDSSIILKS